MAWIRVVEESEADETLRAVYGRIAKARGKVANILKVQSLRPDAMAGHIDLYRSIMFAPSNITRAEREMIAVAVSAADHCAYCIAHHAEALRRYWREPGRVEALIEKGDVQDLPMRTRSMLRYAVKLTREPGAVSASDVESLRKAGLSDVDILDVAQVVAYFNFVNRMAVGLGVEFSEEETKGYEY
ncbi:peroxidase-related enzyme [Candidatus Bipolaricaulota bacterium]|nr:peroxidase-related enzyme [Candidatus Bipolaricaulota bacterium]